MKKIIIFSILFFDIFFSYSYAKVNYNPDDLSTFKKTGQCPGCDLSEADLANSSYPHALLDNAILSEASLSSSNFGASSFKSAILSGAYLTSTNASGSDFTGANLTNTHLNKADLTTTNLTKVNFTGADLSYANLVGATVDLNALQAAKTLSCAYMPDGSQHPSDSGLPC